MFSPPGQDGEAEQQSVETLVDDVIGGLGLLGLKGQVVVVGHSMGGFVAAGVAVKVPERVMAVVGIGPVNPGGKGVVDVFRKRIDVVEKGL